MIQEVEIIEANWQGPFSWPTLEAENQLDPIPQNPGIYLFTFDYQEGYLIHAAGITRRAVPARLKQHTRKYMNGEYNVLRTAAAQQGVRQEVWHGWGYARDHRNEFEERRAVILEAVRQQLINYRVFVAYIGIQPRLLERFEAAIMNVLYKQLSPICDLPDRGMQLSSRWKSEEPVIVRDQSDSVLYGLPKLLEI